MGAKQPRDHFDKRDEVDKAKQQSCPRPLIADQRSCSFLRIAVHRLGKLSCSLASFMSLVVTAPNAAYLSRNARTNC